MSGFGSDLVIQPSPSEAVQEASPIEVDIDPEGRVTDVRIGRLPEELRRPEGLDAAFGAALAHRHAAARPAAPLQLDADGRPIVRRLDPPAWRPMRELVAESLARPVTVPTRGSARPIGGERGVSDNECVAVVLDPAGNGGNVDAEPGWLQNAAEPNIAAAIVQAFSAAYEVRESR